MSARQKVLRINYNNEGIIKSTNKGISLTILLRYKRRVWKIKGLPVKWIDFTHLNTCLATKDPQDRNMPLSHGNVRLFHSLSIFLDAKEERERTVREACVSARHEGPFCFRARIPFSRNSFCMFNDGRKIPKAEGCSVSQAFGYLGSSAEKSKTAKTANQSMKYQSPVIAQWKCSGDPGIVVVLKQLGSIRDRSLFIARGERRILG